jgi:hypothetical protein
MRQNDMLRGAVVFAMDTMRKMKNGQRVDVIRALETLGRQLSEARATNIEIFEGMIAPEPVDHASE